MQLAGTEKPSNPQGPPARVTIRELEQTTNSGEGALKFGELGPEIRNRAQKNVRLGWGWLLVCQCGAGDNKWRICLLQAIEQRHQTLPRPPAYQGIFTYTRHGAQVNGRFVPLASGLRKLLRRRFTHNTVWNRKIISFGIQICLSSPLQAVESAYSSGSEISLGIGKR